jgi:hypothetical protein
MLNQISIHPRPPSLRAVDETTFAAYGRPIGVNLLEMMESLEGGSDCMRSIVVNCLRMINLVGRKSLNI